MNKEEMDSIVNALNRINRSLDERFEKDADLYIPAERVEKLKNLIYLGNYKEIVKECVELKIFSSEGMANVLIKNAWLMRKNSKYDELRMVFQNCDYRYFQSVMTEGVFENKFEMPSEFRLLLLSIFLSQADSVTCQHMLEQNLLFLNQPKLRAICVAHAIKDFPPLERYRKFKSYAQISPNLLTQSKELKKFFGEDFFTDDVKNAIFDEDFGRDHQLSSFWVNCLKSDDAEYMFSRFLNLCKRNSGNIKAVSEFLQYIFSLGRKNEEKNMPLLAEYFAESCNAMDGFLKSKLAEKGMLKVSNKYEAIFQQALASKGIQVEKKEPLPDLDEIIDKMNEHLRPSNSNLYRFLIVAFVKQYANDYAQSLDRIGEEVSPEVFAEFCCQLVERTERNILQNMKYLIYVIDNLISNNNGNVYNVEQISRRMLRHIENFDMFHTCKNEKGIEKIKTFVKDKDFNLFRKLTGI